MAAYEVLLLNTAVPQIQAAQAGDTYVVPRDIAFSAALTLSAGTANGVPYLNGSKVLTSGSALTFDGVTFGNAGAFGTSTSALNLKNTSASSSSNIVEQQYWAANSFTGLDVVAKFGALNPLASANNYGAFYWSLANAGAPTEQMRLTSTGLGIGTSSPAYKLDVVIGAGSGNLFRAGQSGVSNGYTITSDGSALTHFWATTGEAMRLDASGNLGLGVTPSVWNITSKAIQVGVFASISQQANGAANFGFNFYESGANTFTYSTSDEACRFSALIDGGFGWFTAPSGTAGNAISFTQAMTLNASGSLSIGTTAADNKVTVYDTNYPFVQFCNSSTGTGANVGFRVGYEASVGAYIDNLQNSPMIFRTNGSERARITSDGNLVVGDTSTTSRIHAVKTADSATEIKVSNGSSGNSARSDVIVSSNDATGIFTGLSSTNTNASAGGRASTVALFTGSSDSSGGIALLARNAAGYITFHTGGNTERVRINATGDLVGAGTTSIIYWEGVYNNTTASAANMFVASNGSFARSTSALKYKQDIRNLENVDIDSIRAVRYKSKCDNDDQTKDHFGVIADEVDQAGIKELVNYGPNGEVEGFQYERLTVVLLKELQSLRARVAQLEGN